MNQQTHNKIVSFIWSIADDCLRDVYVRGKYRDVILPMVVLRRIDVLLETTKDQVLEELAFQQRDLKLNELDAQGLKKAAGYVFYNISEWSLQKLYSTASNSSQTLLANFENYLDGFDANVKEILTRFKLKEQLRHMAKKDILLNVLEKIVSPEINLSPIEKINSNGYKMPALTNLGMGYVFEELIRRFNEENNEEAGEHFTPREVIQLMTHLLFQPLAGQLANIVEIYDPACGTGGMLTESENYLRTQFTYQGDVNLYGKEINDETYAICKSDMMIKGKNPENILVGSTLASDSFYHKKFDFMLSNPPYGKSWASDVKYIKDGKAVIDARFRLDLADYWHTLQADIDATPRSSDGQLLFLLEMVNKLKPVKANKIGSRIASVHNGSSLFTGDAGGGESNIRRYIIENDLLDAIIQLPNNMFYNTGITTYIWLLSNNKSSHRKGKVQLIDASQAYQKLRKNLGAKNCEFSAEHIAQIEQIYLDFKNNHANGIKSKIFNNHDFGYYKVDILRPKRLKTQFSAETIATLRFKKEIATPMEFLYKEYGEEVYSSLDEHAKEIAKLNESEHWDLDKKKLAQLANPDTWQKQRALMQIATQLMQHFGTEPDYDFNLLDKKVTAFFKTQNIKISATDKKAIYSAVCVYDEAAAKVIKKSEQFSAEQLDRLLTYLGCTQEQLVHFGYYPQADGSYLQYESETELKDSENIGLNESILNYYLAEVKPHVAEAWIDLASVKIGYEISFNKYFYQPQPLRDISEIAEELLELDQQAENLIKQLLKD